MESSFLRSYNSLHTDNIYNHTDNLPGRSSCIKPIEAANIATMASAELVSLGAHGSSKRMSWVRWRNQGEKDWRSRPPSGVTHPAQRLSTPDQTSRTTGCKEYLAHFLHNKRWFAGLLRHFQECGLRINKIIFLTKQNVYKV